MHPKTVIVPLGDVLYSFALLISLRLTDMRSPGTFAMEIRKKRPRTRIFHVARVDQTPNVVSDRAIPQPGGRHPTLERHVTIREGPVHVFGYRHGVRGVWIFDSYLAYRRHASANSGPKFIYVPPAPVPKIISR